MATRQYIGARYVPKFYENPSGGSEWLSGVGYEALTVVTYGGNSYTSKKTVPSNIGAPNANPEYWASTGIYNSQIESLREEVEALSEQYDDISEQAMAGATSSYFYGKKICVYGDSISNSPTPATSYWGILNSEYGIDITNRAISGSTLEGSINAIESATDLATFDIIALAFGTNEWQSSRDYMRVYDNYIRAIRFIQSQAPNSKIIFITPIYGHNSEFESGITNVNNLGHTLEYYVKWINEIAYEYGCGVIDLFHTGGCNKYNYSSLLDISTGFGDIYVHPNANYARQLAGIVLNSTFDSQDRIDTVNEANYFTTRLFANRLSPFSDLAQMPQACRGGLKITVPASATITGNSAIYIPPVKMHLALACSEDCTVNFKQNGNVIVGFNITAGYFDTVINFRDYSNSVVAYDIEIINSQPSPLYIGRMMLKEMHSNYGCQDNYETGVGLTPSEGITFNGTPRVMSDDKTISLTGGYVTLSASLNSGHLGSFSAANFPGGGYFFEMEGSDHTQYLIYLHGYYLSVYGTVPAGSYRILPKTINPYYQA